MVEMPGPGLVGIVLADDRRRPVVGDVDADTIDAVHVVAMAAAAQAPGPLVHDLRQAPVVDRGARHAQRRVHADHQVAVLVDAAIGIEDGRRQPVALVDAGRARGAVSGGADAASRDPVLEGEARGAAKQRVLDHRRVGAVEKHAGRLTRLVLDDLDVVGRLGGARDAGARQRLCVGDADEWLMHPPAPGHADIDRMVGRDRIEVVARREAAFLELIGAAYVAELGRSHRHEDEPFALGRAPGREFDRLDDRADRVSSGQRVTAARLQSLAVHMGVGIVEPRAGRPPPEVDDAGRPTPPREQVGRRADGRDAPPRHGDGLGDGPEGVHRNDLAVVQDQIVLGHGAAPSQTRLRRKCIVARKPSLTDPEHRHGDDTGLIQPSGPGHDAAPGIVRRTYNHRPNSREYEILK